VIGPYVSDIEYLDDRFQLLATMLKIRSAEADQGEEAHRWDSDKKPEVILRELR
jgi:hypothetical protein